jgi:hypothetical protein
MGPKPSDVTSPDSQSPRDERLKSDRNATGACFDAKSAMLQTPHEPTTACVPFSPSCAIVNENDIVACARNSGLTCRLLHLPRGLRTDTDARQFHKQANLAYRYSQSARDLVRRITPPDHAKHLAAMGIVDTLSRT